MARTRSCQANRAAFVDPRIAELDEIARLTYKRSGFVAEPPKVTPKSTSGSRRTSPRKRAPPIPSESPKPIPAPRSGRKKTLKEPTPAVEEPATIEKTGHSCKRAGDRLATPCFDCMRKWCNQEGNNVSGDCFATLALPQDEKAIGPNRCWACHTHAYHPPSPVLAADFERLRRLPVSRTPPAMSPI